MGKTRELLSTITHNTPRHRKPLATKSTLGKAAADALAKVAAVLAPDVRDALRNPTVLPGPPGYGYPQNTVELNVYRQAIRTQAKLHIDYADVNKTPSQRLIWPLALGFLNEARPPMPVTVRR